MRILLVEDDNETVDFIVSGLRESGHNVAVARDGQDGLFLAGTTSFDVIIVDRMLPLRDGLSVVRLLRETQVRTPVLFLSTLAGVRDRVDGLNAGGDDYLVKPFAFSELLARVNALARRPVLAAEPTVLRLGRMSLDLIRHSVTCGGRPIELQPREFRLLEFLMRNAERLVTRTMMLEHVWEFHFDPKTSVVETHISRLRAKIEGHDGAPTIKTIRGAGYILHVSQDMAHEHDRAAGAN